MLTRRNFIAATGSLLITALLPGRALAASLADKISDTWQQINATRNSGGMITVDSILQTLSLPSGSAELRRAVFELVRRIPYQLSPWNGEPMSLFQQGFGDCRHKAAATEKLLLAGGVPAKKTQVRFDWADLPIPPAILTILPQTQGLHNTVVFEFKGKELLLDATWDIALRSAGFPVMPSWDGNTNTWGVTASQSSVLQPVIIPQPGQDIYSANQMSWPQREKTMAFNQALNAWLEGIRASRDDWCTIIHSDVEVTRLSLKTCLGQLS
ncbi:Tat pathway signal sequence [Dickeya dadantii]|uniref:Tat pathway signal sequence n=1 Tax=Dickeya dadantii TaxID=204038 RepID=UPI001CF3B73E|nr:Tat pathway signal sequence [Dickeya dadantii]MCA7014373.1 Tat pathway signal sequence [Dickeya dadantii]